MQPQLSSIPQPLGNAYSVWLKAVKPVLFWHNIAEELAIEVITPRFLREGVKMDGLIVPRFSVNSVDFETKNILKVCLKWVSFI